MVDCIFCKIVAGQIPAEKVYEDSDIVVFPDVRPQAAVHLLVVPKRHLAGMIEVGEADQELLGRIQVTISKVAAAQKLSYGYRVLVNAGRFQEVPHLHYHLLGGDEKGGIN